MALIKVGTTVANTVADADRDEDLAKLGEGAAVIGVNIAT